VSFFSTTMKTASLLILALLGLSAANAMFIGSGFRQRRLAGDLDPGIVEEDEEAEDENEVDSPPRASDISNSVVPPGSYLDRWKEMKEAIEEEADDGIGRMPHTAAPIVMAQLSPQDLLSFNNMDPERYSWYLRDPAVVSGSFKVGYRGNAAGMAFEAGIRNPKVYEHLMDDPEYLSERSAEALMQIAARNGFTDWLRRLRNDFEVPESLSSGDWMSYGRRLQNTFSIDGLLYQAAANGHADTVRFIAGAWKASQSGFFSAVLATLKNHDTRLLETLRDINVEKFDEFAPSALMESIRHDNAAAVAYLRQIVNLDAGEEWIFQPIKEALADFDSNNNA
jgi:hypothetical protein